MIAIQKIFFNLLRVLSAKYPPNISNNLGIDSEMAINDKAKE